MSKPSASPNAVRRRGARAADGSSDFIRLLTEGPPLEPDRQVIDLWTPPSLTELAEVARPRGSWIGNPNLAPVSEQDPWNTCVAHAGARMLETMLATTGRRVSLEANQFHQCMIGLRCGQKVTAPGDALSLMVSSGAPIADGRFVVDRICPPAPQLIRAAGIAGFVAPNLVKAYIAGTGPVVATISVEKRFETVRDATIWHDTPGAPRPLDHAVLLVGYDDDPQSGEPPHWILQNSFGTDWGANGYGRIAYGHAQILGDVLHRAYGFRV